MDARSMLEVAVTAAALLQLVAAVLALRLIPISRGRLAWILISFALLLMSIRRALSLVRIRDMVDVVIDPWSEATGLTISVLMVWGVFRIAPLFQERERLESKLRQAEKLEAIGQLAGGIAHDFNNQLLVIMGYADELARSLEVRPLRNSAEAIVSAAQRSAALTRSLLAFARKGGRPGSRVDVHRLIGEVEALLVRTIDRRVEVRSELRADVPVVIGDPAHFQSMLLNLALNARDAMPEGGQLIFSTRCVVIGPRDARVRELGLTPGRHVVIGVADTGPGIAPEVRAHLFEPFFTTKPLGKGTGLGLASVYGTVRNAGGGIEVDGTPGQGAAFLVYLPAAPAAPAEAPGRAVMGTLPGKARVMVVEDEEAIRQLLVAMLRELGHSPVACRDGAEAAALFQRTSKELDLVILDAVMPRMGGEDTLAALTAIDPGVRVVVCSGRGADAVAGAQGSANVLGHLHKPFLLGDLAEVVARALPATSAAQA